MAYLFADNDRTFECKGCREIKMWYEFKIKKEKKANHLCFKCQSKDLTIKFKRIITMANENNMQTLRDKLFDCIDDLKYKRISVNEAKEICNVAQTIINSVKVEVDYMKVIGGKQAGTFMALGS